ncbi:MAG: L-threonylcarbamoyladenylate synthase [Spirochaeta sp.]|jgi:L-threonylcarbamoyladenylate synthase|nr:L-threonylcarbamoyladenylate synthase [Spirochaeta sp.]
MTVRARGGDGDGASRSRTRRLTEYEGAAAGRLLAAGELVVIPTETVYGLAAAADDPAAVGEIFRAKERPADNPLIVHYADPVSVLSLLPAALEDVETLITALMPGPLTLVIPAPAWVPRIVTGGLETVAVRVPALSVTREIIRAAGRPVAAPSANRSGRPSPTTFEMALTEMDGRVAAILDGGQCRIGIESTVVDVCTPGVFSVLRPGQITADDIAAHTHRRPAPAARIGHSPGTRYRHYHPEVPVVVVPPQDWDAAWEEARTVCREPRALRAGEIGTYTAGLFRFFAEAEAAGADCILVEDVPEARAPGLHDRLHRAADRNYRPGVIQELVTS